MNRNSPVFIIASERSGTNLLRTLLSNHSKLEGPLATHLLHVFYKVAPYYGDISKKENCEVVFNHFKKSVNHPFTNWAIAIDFDDFYQKYAPTSLIEVFHSIHKEKVGGQVNYVCKDKNLYDNFAELSEELPRAKFIYLCRDPRDYVVSNLKTPRSLWTTRDNAMAWCNEQNKCLDIYTHNTDKVIKVKYEDLVTNAELEMKKVLHFLQLEIEEKCFQVDAKKSKNITWNKHWENLDKPIMKGNFNKYEKSLSQNQIMQIETICKDNMLQLGYSLHTKANWTGILPDITNRLENALRKMSRMRYIRRDQKLPNDKTVLNRSLLEEIRTKNE